MKKTTKNDATLAANAQRNEIKALIAQLEKAIEPCDGVRVNWGEVGSLTEIKRQLADTVRFATGAEEEPSAW